MAVPNSCVQQIAVEDIASFVVLAFDKRGRFLGKRVGIAGDEVTATRPLINSRARAAARSNTS